jgi:hypothetical protein
MQAIYHSGRENAMTTTTTRGPQGTPTITPTGTHAGTTGSPRTSGVVAGLLMVTGIGWNAGLQAQPFHPATTGVTALVIRSHTLLGRGPAGAELYQIQAQGYR